MNNAPTSRKEFLLRMLRTPVAIGLLVALGVCLGYLLWQWRAGIYGFTIAAVYMCTVVFLAGLLPMALGFTVQFFMRRPAPEFAMWLAAAAMAAIAIVFSGGLRLSVDSDAPAWAFLAFQSVAFLMLVSFLSTGAAVCRRCFPRRFSTVNESPPPRE